MGIVKRRLALALATAVLLTTGCVVLSGQRIALRYDASADRLTARIAYDGVFDTDEETSKGIAQVRRFVDEGRLMLVDWWGELALDRALEVARDPKTPPAFAAFLAAVDENTTLRALGHYRDVDGRIGAMHELVVENASRVLALANAALDEAVLGGEVGPEEGNLPGTRRALIDAAREGHEWFRFEGNALVADVPARFEDWSVLECELLAELIDVEPGEERSPAALHPRWVAHLLSSAALSIEKEAEHVRVRMGLPDRPLTLRLPLREGYRPNLEDVVVELAPEDYDRELARELLSAWTRTGEQPDGTGLALPEDEVRAVLGVLESGDGGMRNAAVTWLDRRGARWNAELRAPRAPASGLPMAAQVAAWKAWVRTLVGTL